MKLISSSPIIFLLLAFLSLFLYHLIYIFCVRMNVLEKKYSKKNKWKLWENNWRKNFSSLLQIEKLYLSFHLSVFVDTVLKNFFLSMCVLVGHYRYFPDWHSAENKRVSKAISLFSFNIILDKFLSLLFFLNWCGLH
jgi:flagellar biosynthesis protein FlhB